MHVERVVKEAACLANETFSLHRESVLTLKTLGDLLLAHLPVNSMLLPL